MGSQDGGSEAATFSFPHAVLVLPDGSALVSDSGNDAVRHISVEARTGLYCVRRVSSRGFTWLRPRGMAQLPDGGVLVCDSGHNRIRLLGADGSVSIFAGTGRKGMHDGPALAATFDSPSGVCVMADGSVLVADTGNHCIRSITGGGMKRTVSTLAGCGRAGKTDGPAGGASFDKPTAIVALGGASGLSDGQSVVYVADSGNSCLRRISTGNRHGDLNVGTLCGQAGSPGGTDGAFAEALFGNPTSLAVLPDGALVVSDSTNNNLRRVSVHDRTVSTLAGAQDRGWGLIDGTGAEARFNVPRGLAVSPIGEIWVADSANHCVRLLREEKVQPFHASPPPPLPPPQSAASWLAPGEVAPHGRESSGSSSSVAAPRVRASPSRAMCSARAHRPHQHPLREDERDGGGDSAFDVTDGGHSEWDEAAGGAADGHRPVKEASSPPFATERFAADAQLFEREAPKAKGAAQSTRGGWAYSGPASVTLRRAPFPNAATLSVRMHGRATAEVSVLRPNQMTLRDTAFVVCTHDAVSGAGFAGFGANELGLRFRSTTAAASLLAACEAIVGGLEDTGAVSGATAALVAAAADESVPPHGLRDSSASSALTLQRGSPRPARESGAGGRISSSSGRASSSSAMGTPRRVSSIPTLRRPRPGAAAAADESTEGRLQQAEQDVLRLSARLAERDLEVGRLFKQLEQAQVQMRARDAKVAELTRRVAAMQGKR